MFTKKHRQSLRGLSHEDKVKKLEKLTRVPLQNLKTNIIQSDLEQDDIEIPISLKLIQTGKKENKQESAGSRQKIVVESKKKKQFDQQKINRTIRTMTKELYSLEKQKAHQKSQIKNEPSLQRRQANISSFTIEEIDLKLQKLNKVQPTDNINDLKKHRRHQSSYHQCNQSKQLTQITITANKFNRGQDNKINPTKKPQLMRRRELPSQRQTQPIFIDQVPACQSLKTIQKLPIPQNDIKTKRQSSDSNLTKRFSRTKRNPGSINCDSLQDKKLKFNRSCNQKNKLIPNVSNKENIENFQQSKKILLTERLSYQQIPTYESVELTGLKKRKNIGRFFATNNQRANHQFFSQNDLQKDIKAILKTDKDLVITNKQKIHQQIECFEKISKQDLFRQLQTNAQKSRQSMLISQVFKNYRQSIGLLRNCLQ